LDSSLLFLKKILAISVFAIILTTLISFQEAYATLLTDPNDATVWQGATVGTFAQHFYGSNTLANRQLVITNQLLDDSIFDTTGTTPATLVSNTWSLGGNSGGSDHVGGDTRGYSTDLTGVGGYAYIADNSITVFTAGNTIDNQWFQTSVKIGDTVYDLGGPFTKAAIFNTIDHGPLPQEAIESTVYLSNSPIGPWTQAVVERVWLEGWKSNTGIQWDGFVYAVGTGTQQTFQYVSIIHGGPGALISDGDDEINGVLGVQSNFQQECPPGTTGTFPDCVPTSVIGGEIIPINSVALLVAGVQSSSVWMISVLGLVAGLGFIFLRKKSF